MKRKPQTVAASPWAPLAAVDAPNQSESAGTTATGAVRTSEIRYRRLFEAARDGILILDPTTRKITEANPFMSELLGYSHRELLGKELWEIGLLKDEAASRAAVRELQTKRFIRYEDLPLQTKAGLRRDVEFVSNLYQEDDQTIIQCNIRDITERKQVEVALRESEQRFRTLVEDSPNALLVVDGTGAIRLVNRAAEHLFGYRRDELLGQRIELLLPQSFRIAHPALRAGFAASPQARPMGVGQDLFVLRKDGVEVPVEIGLSLVETPEGPCTLTVVIDISTRKLAEEALRRHAALIDLSPDAIFIRDLPGTIRFWSHGAATLYGWTMAEAIGQTVHALLQTQFPEPLENILAQLERTGEWAGDLVHRCRDGHFVTVRSRWRTQRDAQGRITDLLESNVDITERNRVEKELAASLKEVAELNTEIQEFFHVLCHELKTPLTSAREFVSIVMDGLAGPLNPTQLEYLGIAKESCDQLRRYINDLLDVTRLETGKMSIERQVLQLAALIDEVVEMLTPAATAKGISLSRDCQPDLPAAAIDKQRILQVLTNLTTNAIKFTAAGGQIQLSLHEAPADPGCLQIAVRDTGPGISQDQLAVIFNRRYQAHRNAKSADSQKGLGLGLFICQELVELHGGRIWVESTVGQGSTFTFVLPKQAQMKSVHVLIIDNDAAMRETLRLVLEEQHYQVTTATGGRDGLRLLGQTRPDIVVLDLIMGELVGPSLLKEIRSNWGSIPVIVYTGSPNGELLRQAMETGPFTLLAKPCPPQQFVETIRRISHTQAARELNQNDNGNRPAAAPHPRTDFASGGPVQHIPLSP